MKFITLLVVAVAAAGAIQFVPYGKNHTNPTVTAAPTWDSPKTRDLFARACANCHSNETTWPWYSTIAPVSWLIQSDVDEGREHFNASEYDPQSPRKARDAAEEVLSKEMPPWFYLIGHPEAKLTDAERLKFADGLTKTFGKK
jgi:mono/diheme cytochrome c family protein